VNWSAIKAELEDEMAQAADVVLKRWKVDASTEIHVRVPEPEQVRVDIEVVELEPMETDAIRYALMELD
jgi:hypothetical protein